MWNNKYIKPVISKKPWHLTHMRDWIGIFDLFIWLGFLCLSDCRIDYSMYDEGSTCCKNINSKTCCLPAGALPSKAELLIDPEMDQELDKLWENTHTCINKHILYIVQCYTSSLYFSILPVFFAFFFLLLSFVLFFTSFFVVSESLRSQWALAATAVAVLWGDWRKCRGRPPPGGTSTTGGRWRWKAMARRKRPTPLKTDL